MKKTIIALFMAVNICAYAQIETPAPSPAATLSTKIGITDVKISYSRPRIKGRKIFGTGADFITPYGALWRTAANQGTVITFGDDVEVEGHKVPGGQYLLLSIPGATEWTIILSKNVALGGNTDAYKQAEDAARFTVKSEKLTEKVEMFTMNVTDLSDDNTSAKIQLAWENTSVKFGVKVDVDKKIMSSIASSNAAAARYYYDTKKDLKKALEWIDSGIAGNPEAYWNVHLKAQIQKDLGDKAGAIKTAQQSLELAKKDKNAFYIQQNEALIASLK
jgi:tetratricopeptide (TPR) repeat protein